MNTYKGKAIITLKAYGRRIEETKRISLEFTAPTLHVAEDMALEYIHDMFCDAQYYTAHGGLHLTEQGKVIDGLNFRCKGTRDADRVLKRDIKTYSEHYNEKWNDPELAGRVPAYTLAQTLRIKLGDAKYKRALELGLISE